MDSNLKTPGRLFQFFARVSQIKQIKKLISLVFFFLNIIHLILFPRRSESNLCMSKVLRYKFSKFVTKINKIATRQPLEFKQAYCNFN